MTDTERTIWELRARVAALESERAETVLLAARKVFGWACANSFELGHSGSLVVRYRSLCAFLDLLPSHPEFLARDSEPARLRGSE